MRGVSLHKLQSPPRLWPDIAFRRDDRNNSFHPKITHFIPSVGKSFPRSRPIGAHDIRICDRASFSIGAKIAGTIDRENLSEPAPCAINPTLDGADGASADLSSLLVGKS